jgi:hypothetical protein
VKRYKIIYYIITQQYTLNIYPKNYQPSGYADFYKICNPKSTTLTCTNLNNMKIEQCKIVRTEIIKKGKKNYI